MRDILTHLFGIFVCRSGGHRRLDVVLCTTEQLPYALIGGWGQHAGTETGHWTCRSERSDAAAIAQGAAASSGLFLPATPGVPTGWIGNVGLNRLLRNHAETCGMHLSSYG